MASWKCCLRSSCKRGFSCEGKAINSNFLVGDAPVPNVFRDKIFFLFEFLIKWSLSASKFMKLGQHRIPHSTKKTNPYPGHSVPPPIHPNQVSRYFKISMPSQSVHKHCVMLQTPNLGETSDPPSQKLNPPTSWQQQRIVMTTSSIALVTWRTKAKPRFHFHIWPLVNFPSFPTRIK